MYSISVGLLSCIDHSVYLRLIGYQVSIGIHVCGKQKVSSEAHDVVFLIWYSADCRLVQLELYRIQSMHRFIRIDHNIIAKLKKNTHLTLPTQLQPDLLLFNYSTKRIKKSEILLIQINRSKSFSSLAV